MSLQRKQPVFVWITKIGVWHRAKYRDLVPVTLPLQDHQEGLVRVAGELSRFAPVPFCVHVHPLCDSRKGMVRVR